MPRSLPTSRDHSATPQEIPAPPAPHAPPPAPAPTPRKPREKKSPDGRRQQKARAKIKRRAHAKVEATHAAQAQAEEGAATQLSSLPLVNRHAAGIDVGSRSHWVAVGSSPVGPNDPREFPAHTDGLKEIVGWLRTCGVSTVALESTGIYWVPLYELLEAEGFEVLLVDPRYTKQVKGRPKSDRLDCQWIQHHVQAMR